MCRYILSKYVVRLWILASFVVFYVNLCCLGPNLIGKSWQYLIKAKTGRREINKLRNNSKASCRFMKLQIISLYLLTAFLNLLTASLVVCTHVINSWSCVLITYTKCTFLCIFLCSYSNYDGRVFKKCSQTDIQSCLGSFRRCSTYSKNKTIKIIESTFGEGAEEWKSGARNTH